jgi:hypothetical protein
MSADNFFLKNISALETRGIKAPIAPKGESIKTAFIESTRVPNTPTVYVTSDSETIYIHSRMNPVKEAERFVKTHTELESATGAIVYGFGLGYLIEAMLRLHPNLERIAVIECNMEILSMALEARDLSNLLNDPRVNPIFGQFDEIRDRLVEETDRPGVSSETVEVIVHSPSLKAMPDFEKEVKQLFQFIQASRGRKTSRPFESLCRENMARNSSLIPHSRGISVFQNMFDGVPAIIVGAGPSLDRNAFLLRALDGQALILCVDSALRPLLTVGVQPHFVFTVDPQSHVTRYFEGCADYNGSLIHAIQSCPETSVAFAKEKRFVFFTHGDERLFSDMNPDENDFLDSAPSVFLSTVDFAVRTGANPIILVGSDLAVTSRQTHSSLSAGSIKMSDIKSGLKHSLKDMRELPGYFGRSVRTTLTFQIYLNHHERFIEHTSRVEFFNSTEGGATIKGNVQRPLKEMLAREIGNGIDVNKTICEISHMK